MNNLKLFITIITYTLILVMIVNKFAQNGINYYLTPTNLPSFNRNKTIKLPHHNKNRNQLTLKYDGKGGETIGVPNKSDKHTLAGKLAQRKSTYMLPSHDPVPIFYFWEGFYDDMFRRAMNNYPKSSYATSQPCKIVNVSGLPTADFVAIDPFNTMTRNFPTNSQYVTRLKKGVKFVLITFESAAKLKTRKKSPNTFPRPNITFWENFFDVIVTVHPSSDVMFPYGDKLRIPKRAGKKSNVDMNLETFGKKKLIMAAIGNCHAKRRLKFVNELKRYIPEMDLYGDCFHNPICYRLKANTSNTMVQDSECFTKLLTSYKFVIAIENSDSCPGYITEKYGRRITKKSGPVPIVGGTDKQTYIKWAIPDSFIHINDFDSVLSLAKYIKNVGNDLNLYLRYVTWKKEWIWRQYPQEVWFKLCNQAKDMLEKERRVKGLKDSSYYKIMRRRRFYKWWSSCSQQY